MKRVELEDDTPVIKSRNRLQVRPKPEVTSLNRGRFGVSDTRKQPNGDPNALTLWGSEDE